MSTMYTIEDIDWAWLRLFESIGTLSDGTEIPIAVEADSSEDGPSPYPAIAIELINCIPDLAAYEGWRSMPAGFEYGVDGKPLAEKNVFQPEHYKLQYKISTRCVRPDHDRELIRKIALYMSPRLQLFLKTTTEPDLFLDAFQIHATGVLDRTIFRSSMVTNSDRREITRSWMYIVRAAFPNPYLESQRVTRTIVWKSVGDMDAPTSPGSTTFEIKAVEADPLKMNEFNIDNQGQSGTLLKVVITED